MTNYTPSTEDVRERFTREMPLGSEFDRWLAQERAKAWDEGAYDSRYTPDNPYRKDTL